MAVETLTLGFLPLVDAAPMPIAVTLGPDGFFDGRLFDPDQIDAYLAGLPR